jgi:DNA-binding SARP family transcriptional activator/tetratricopeptide (TPR) repeat protein
MLKTGSQSVRLGLLGGALLHAPNRKAWKLERKTAALLAFLTLEGGTTRSRLAGLLWPDSIESTARNNLSQAARRLREGAGIALLTGDDSLGLNPELSIDVAQLELEAFAGNDETVLGFAGELLEGLDYDDCPEFQDWLLIKRESFLGLRRDAHVRLSQAAELAGQSRLALEHANHVLELDPVSEVAHRHVMRLHYQNGDRGAALNAFERCKQTLEQELGVPPLPETLALAKAISQGATVQQPTMTRLEIPLTVLRPPILVGREREWQQLETAWNQGLQIVICGDPGIGKSRLLFDFAASHGQHLLLEGRPGDANVSFSSYARSLRRTLSTFPRLELEDWVRSEFSRLLPELTNTAPAPLQNQEDKLRFFEAITCALETICQQQVLSSIVVDDLQFMDAASLEAHEYILTRLMPTGLRFLNAHRSNELPATLEERIQTEIGTGTSVRIQIKVLEVEQVSRWIASLKIDAPDLSTRLVKHTGGNPMFMLETIKSLLETGQLAQNTALPTPTRVGTLIRQRLERLSTNALRLARVAAITGTDYSLGLAAKILETNALDLSEIAGELEQAQLMIAERFAHDLIFEAVQAGTPQTIKTFLHHQTALQLEASGTDPARIAHHWFEANEIKRATAFLCRAGEVARDAFRLQEGAAFFTKAANVFNDLQDHQAAFNAHRAALDLLARFDTGEQREQTIEQLLLLAESTAQRADILMQHSMLLCDQSKHDAAVEVAQRAHRAAIESKEYKLLMRSWNQKGQAFAGIFEIENAFESFNTAKAIALEHNEVIFAAETQANASVLYSLQDRNLEALETERQITALFRTVNEPRLLCESLLNYSTSLSNLGFQTRALTVIDEANSLLNTLGDDRDLAFPILLNQAGTLNAAYQYNTALEVLERLTLLDAEYQSPFRAHLYQFKIEAFTRLGQYERAQALITDLEQLSTYTAGRHVYVKIFLNDMQGGSLQQIQEAEALFTSPRRPFAWHRLHLVKILLVPADQGLDMAHACIEAAQARGYENVTLTAEIRAVVCLLKLGQNAQALEYSQRAQERATRVMPELCYFGEVLLTHQQVLDANHHPDASAHLERTLSWLQDVANNHVPPEYRQSFLERNPHNAAILELARNAGLKIS